MNEGTVLERSVFCTTGLFCLRDLGFGVEGRGLRVWGLGFGV